MNKPEILQRVRVVLIRTSHPGNIGAAARAIKTMGLGRLYLVQPKSFPHPEADARASGAVDVLQQAVVCDSLDDALAGTVFAVGLSARRRDLSPVVETPRRAANDLLELAAHAEVALVFGTEVSGLTNAELDRCQLLMTIPANPAYSSLNLAAAVQVVGYELRSSIEQDLPSGPAPARASLEEVERFYGHLESTLIDTGFLDPAQPKRLMQKLRRLFNRSALEQEEVNILRGILSSVPTRR